MSPDPKRTARWARECLEAAAVPGRREATQGYFPTAMEILGVPAPDARKVVRQIQKEWKKEPAGALLELVRILRAGGTHEERSVAFELLGARADARRALGEDGIEAMGEGNDNWASVDGYAVFVSGPAWREGVVGDRRVLAWAGSRDRWWRRSALVSTVPLNMASRGGTGDPRRTLLVCRALARDPDPMVAKALSWALRALIGRDRDAVEGFLAEHGAGLPSLVRREVRNKLETGRKNRP